MNRPNPQCVVCTNAYLGLTVAPDMTLQELVLHLSDPGSKPDLPGELTIQQGERLLYDVEYEDHLDKPLDSLIQSGDHLLITNDCDEDDQRNHSIVAFCYFDASVEKVEWSGNVSNLPARPVPIVEEAPPPPSPNKRKAEDGGSSREKVIVLDDTNTIEID